MRTKNVKELVVYTIKPEFKDDVTRVQDLVKECVANFDGFINIESYQSTSNELQLMDWLSWETLKDAKYAQKEFEKLPKYNALLSYLDDMKFSDHFKL
jgi:heme-degrading monooxygenase HmoA